MATQDTVVRLERILSGIQNIDDLTTKRLIQTLIFEFKSQIKKESNTFVEPNPCKEIPLSEPEEMLYPVWCGSYKLSETPIFTTYSNRLTGESFSVGDHVQIVDTLLKGTILKFETVKDNILVYIEWGWSGNYKSNCSINRLEKLTRKDTWLHKPTNSKFTLVVGSLNTTFSEQSTGVMGTFPSFLLNNSQDWIKL